nr:nucleic acid-binding, OB-fold protein [Tanacetum cinerariifolium]
MEQPVIIAVSSCRVSTYRDYQLAASPTTYYYLNPKILEAQESRALNMTMEWLPMCAELEEAVGARNWLDMVVLYCRQFSAEHRDFAIKVNMLVG